MDRNSGHNRLINYFRIGSQIERITELNKKGIDRLCALCFEPECNHKLPTDGYNDALAQLKFWQDIAFSEARCVLVHPEHPIPRWESLIKDEGNLFNPSDFYFYPYLPDIQVVLVKRHQTIRLPDEHPIGKISAKTGYYYYGVGQLICRFENGLFTPNIEILDTEPPGEGLWYAIPRVSDYKEFITLGVHKVELK